MKIAKLIFLLAFTFVLTNGNASVHAGNITYSWLYGYTYQIKYTIYTTNNMVDNYCQINSVCFGNGVTILRSNGPCSGSCSPGGCEGEVLPGGTLKMSEYVTTKIFPGPGNYIICLEIPNRNAGIENIPNSVNQVFYIESFLAIPMFGSGKNNSPIFGNHPISVGCSNNGCFTYNPLAIDPDGDSLSYEIDLCKGANGTIPGYTYPVSGTSGTFSIDPISGTLSWCNPQTNGAYNVVIRIKEWRKDDDGNYFRIGYVERDTQFTMSTCTGFNEQDEFEKEIIVSPNPTAGYLLVSLPKENVSIDLMDICGKTIYSESNINSQSYPLHLENINQGIYFLKITGTNHSTITKKIVKQ